MFDRALTLIPLNEGYLSDLIIKTGLCLYKLGNQTGMLQLINRYEAISPLSAELLFLSREPGNSSDTCEKLWGNIKQILFAKEACECPAKY